MKKLIGLFLVGAGLSINAHAQKHTNIEVPAAVKTAFTQQYGSTSARWTKSGEEYEAHFKHNRQEMSAVYAPDGTLAATETELKVWQLPLPVIDYVEQHYGSSIKDAAKVTKANGEINYEAVVKGKEVVFDASCALVKEEGK